MPTDKPDYTKSNFVDHPNYDPKTEAAVAAWVKKTRGLDWNTLGMDQQGEAYVAFFMELPDEDIDAYLEQGTARNNSEH